MNRTRKARPILVAVRKPDRGARSVLRKAASLAKLYDAPLRIVHVLAIPQGALARAGATVRQAAQADLDQRTVQLEKLAQRAELRELEVSTTVRCDYPVQDALVREAIACHARMLLVESHGPGQAAVLLLVDVLADFARRVDHELSDEIQAFAVGPLAHDVFAKRLDEDGRLSAAGFEAADTAQHELDE